MTYVKSTMLMLAAVPAHRIVLAAEMVLCIPLNTPLETRVEGTAPVAWNVPMMVALFPHKKALQERLFATVALEALRVVKVAFAVEKVPPTSRLPVTCPLARVRSPPMIASPTQFDVLHCILLLLRPPVVTIIDVACKISAVIPLMHTSPAMHSVIL